MTLSIKGVFVTLSTTTLAVMLSAIMQSVTFYLCILNVIRLSAIVLNFVKMNKHSSLLRKSVT